jgi:hypothetical protein
MGAGILAGAGLMSLLLAQSGQSPPAPKPTPEQIERMKAIYQPSAPHLALAKLEGTWEQEVRLASGSGDPVVIRGRAVNRVVLGGRFVVSEGQATGGEGAPALDSMLIFGFDGRTREYTSVVMDTFGTYYVTAAGAPGQDAGAIAMKGQTPERGAMKQFDVVLTWIDADTYRTEIIFRFPDRPPSAAVSTTYRRMR